MKMRVVTLGLIAAYLAANGYVFSVVDAQSHSVSDTLINFLPYLLLLTLLFSGLTHLLHSTKS